MESSSISLGVDAVNEIENSLPLRASYSSKLAREDVSDRLGPS